MVKKGNMPKETEEEKETRKINEAKAAIEKYPELIESYNKVRYEFGRSEYAASLEVLCALHRLEERAKDPEPTTVLSVKGKKPSAMHAFAVKCKKWKLASAN